jgi:hypothetical protein
MKNRVEIILILAITSVAFWSCSDEVNDPLLEEPANSRMVVYEIPAGAHHASPSSFQPLINISMLKFKARFDSSAIYKTLQTQNQPDINKLYGMSDCSGNHQLNSARFGWRWYNDELQIWAYAYVNQARKAAFIKSVALGSSNMYELTFTDSTYTFKVGETAVSISRHCHNKASGYRLYPYFGGDEVAPHRITIEIEEIR